MAAERHEIRVVVHDAERGIDHGVQQATYRTADRACFNLFITDEKQAFLRSFDGFRRLGDLFEVHEGVHSGNIRKALFVSSVEDETCRPLILGGNELKPYYISWAGRYIRLGAVPARRSKERYANIGKAEWFAEPKLIVQRTGDSIKAAVDHAGKYVSNNFFVILPTVESDLDLDGLCAVLNSTILTKYFRTIEPREGRAFAEVKIKHLTVFPVPVSADGPSVDVRALNHVGKLLADAGQSGVSPDPALVAENETAVARAFRLPEGVTATGAAP